MDFQAPPPSAAVDWLSFDTRASKTQSDDEAGRQPEVIHRNIRMMMRVDLVAGNFGRSKLGPQSDARILAGAANVDHADQKSGACAASKSAPACRNSRTWRILMPKVSSARQLMYAPFGNVRSTQLKSKQNGESPVAPASVRPDSGR